MDVYSKFFIVDREGEAPEMRQLREEMGRGLVRQWWILEEKDRASYASYDDEDDRDGSMYDFYYEKAEEEVAERLTEDRPFTREEEKEIRRKANEMIKAEKQKHINQQLLIEQQLEGIGWRKGNVFEEYNEEAPYWRMMEQRAVDRDRGRW